MANVIVKNIKKKNNYKKGGILLNFHSREIDVKLVRKFINNGSSNLFLEHFAYKNHILKALDYFITY